MGSRSSVRERSCGGIAHSVKWLTPSWRDGAQSHLEKTWAGLLARANTRSRGKFG